MYLGFVYNSTARKPVYSWTFYVAAVLGVIIELLSIIGIATHIPLLLSNATTPFETVNGSVVNVTLDVTTEKILFSWTPLGLLVLIFGLPMMAACFTSSNTVFDFFHSPIWYILWSFPIYFFFLPTLVAVFGAYSLARLFDFSWGNRDSSGSIDKLGARSDILQKRAKFISPVFVLLNIFLVLILIDVQLWTPMLLTFSTVIFGPPLITILLSLIYFMVRPCCSFRCCY